MVFFKINHVEIYNVNAKDYLLIADKIEQMDVKFSLDTIFMNLFVTTKSIHQMLLDMGVVCSTSTRKTLSACNLDTNDFVLIIILTFIHIDLTVENVVAIKLKCQTIL